MPKGTNQKFKLIRLMNILLEYTDSEHGLTIGEIMEKLSLYDITADRKSLYDDFEALRLLGLDILMEQKGRSSSYKVVGRDFELPELKLLVDSVAASRFITGKKSRELIKKLEKLCSSYEGKELSRQVVVSGRIKTMNESIYYNVDLIHNSIGRDREISFLYYKWNIQKELEPRRSGNPYIISPFALCWDNENYYLIGFDSYSQSIKHYRVDKMKSIQILNSKRQGQDYFEKLDMAAYSTQSFGMFGGSLEKVRLRLKNELVGAIIDRFGKDLIINPDGDDHFTVNIEAVISDQFFGWVFGLGPDTRITHPQRVARLYENRMKEYLKGVPNNKSQ